MNRLTRKVWLIFVAAIALIITIITLLSYYFYESIYVQEVQATLEQQAENFVMQAGGEVSPELIEAVDAFNVYSTSEIFAVQNPRELSACLPFEINYNALINGEDRQRLVNGEVLVKRGYESRFDRDVLSVITPIVKDERLNGILYSYVPLSPILNFLQGHLLLVGVSGGFLFIFFALLSRVILHSVLRPLKDLQQATERFEKGDYTARVRRGQTDEIGQLSQAFNRMAEAVESEDARKKEFLAIVSHELRTPLSSIVGYSHSLERGILPESSYPEVFSLLSSEAERMKKLTEDLLFVARDEDVFLHPQPLVASDLIQQALKIMQPRIQEKQMTTLVNADDSLIIWVDEAAVLQMLLNVLDNAVNYSPSEKAIHIHLIEQSEFAVFEIEDEGPGIPAEHLLHVTERFYRVNKARSRDDGGSGLGLTIVQNFVKASNGTLTIESAETGGTRIQIALPLWKEE